MESNYHTTVGGQKAASEAELEILIAKYTLEYLYRWTNNFDPAQLSQIKQLLDTDSGSVVLRIVKGDASDLHS